MSTGTRRLLARLRDLDLPAGDFAIFGSGPLVAHGIIPESGDLDVLCRGRAWAEVQRLGQLEHLSEHGVEIVSLDGGRLTFGDRWAIGEFDVDELIDTAETIDGLPYVRLEHVLAYKQIAGRAKDLAHIEAAQRYLEGLESDT